MRCVCGGARWVAVFWVCRVRVVRVLGCFAGRCRAIVIDQEVVSSHGDGASSMTKLSVASPFCVLAVPVLWCERARRARALTCEKERSCHALPFGAE